MKYIIILGDGMADEPIVQLGNKTPLQVAKTPYLDQLASMGRSGMLCTIPDGFSPGSEIANLSVLGYNVAEVFEGRGSLEAASMGVKIAINEMAMRCNLICIENGIIKNHSAGHISDEEATELITYLEDELGDNDIHFYPGVSYRHLLKMKGGNKKIFCTAPHDVTCTPFLDVMIKAESEEAQHTAEVLNKLILKSQILLENHPINIQRAALGKDKANSIWPWSPGYKPQMSPLSKTYPIKSGAVISAVDLIKGIGSYAGLKIIQVPGATGLYNTNYEGKIQAAIKELKETDFVYLHIEASDEAGHEGDIDLKIKTIEYLDQRIVKPLLEELSSWTDPISIAVLPDHPTPCAIRTHTKEAVPFVIYNPLLKPDNIQAYNELTCKNGIYGLIKGNTFMDIFMSGK